jgi:hypothetical protein
MAGPHFARTRIEHHSNRSPLDRATRTKRAGHVDASASRDGDGIAVDAQRQLFVARVTLNACFGFDWSLGLRCAAPCSPRVSASLVILRTSKGGAEKGDGP